LMGGGSATGAAIGRARSRRRVAAQQPTTDRNARSVNA
jgi:hypothetical protein